MKTKVGTTALVAALAGLGAVAAPAQALAPSGGSLTRITAATAEEGETWGNLRGGAEVSNDGRYVVFESASPGLVAGDANGTSDIFLHDTTTGTVTLVSRNAAGGSANRSSAHPAISANGKFIAFDSHATDLDGATNAGISGSLIYRYSVTTGRSKLVSTSPNGALPTAWSTQPFISATGRYVAYSARAHNIVPGDHNSQ